jgi:hypothetical protein
MATIAPLMTRTEVRKNAIGKAVKPPKVKAVKPPTVTPPTVAQVQTRWKPCDTFYDALQDLILRYTSRAHHGPCIAWGQTYYTLHQNTAEQQPSNTSYGMWKSKCTCVCVCVCTSVASGTAWRGNRRTGGRAQECKYKVRCAMCKIRMCMHARVHVYETCKCMMYVCGCVRVCACVCVCVCVCVRAVKVDAY